MKFSNLEITYFEIRTSDLKKNNKVSITAEHITSHADKNQQYPYKCANSALRYIKRFLDRFI